MVTQQHQHVAAAFSSINQLLQDGETAPEQVIAEASSLRDELRAYQAALAAYSALEQQAILLPQAVPPLADAQAATQQVQAYLQAWPKASSIEARNALYPQGLGLLQAVEALKKQVKASYRGDNRAFIASDIDPHAWGLHKEQQAKQKQDLGALRHLRGELLQTLAPSAEALAACAVRTPPEEDTALYSSDEATQLLSDQEHCPRAAALVNGIGKELKGQAEGILENLLDPKGIRYAAIPREDGTYECRPA